MDNVAICLFGISYSENYQHWTLGSQTVDYRKSLQNYKERLFDQINNYEVYYSTYYHSLIDQMKEDYKAKDGVVTVIAPSVGLGINSLLDRNKIILQFEAILANSKHDWYIFTRFDLHLCFDLTELSIDPNRINVLTTLETPYFICDNFYIISRQKLSEFFKLMSRMDINCYNRHDVWFFGGLDNINLMRFESGNPVIPALTAYKIVKGTPQQA